MIFYDIFIPNLYFNLQICKNDSNTKINKSEVIKFSDCKIL